MSRVNRYTAYQSPLLEGETLSRASYCSKALPGFTFGSSGVHLDSADVSLAQEDHRLRVHDQAEESRFYPSGSFERINILETSLSVLFIAIWRSIAASYRTRVVKGN